VKLRSGSGHFLCLGSRIRYVVGAEVSWIMKAKMNECGTAVSSTWNGSGDGLFFVLICRHALSVCINCVVLV